MRVLVVSDDPTVVDEAEFGFAADDVVENAVDSRDALVAARRNRPSVVVVDMQTGSAGGFNLIRALRQERGLQDVPVLVLLERGQDRWLAHEAGAQSIRVKPVEVNDLVAEVSSLSSVKT